MLIAALSTTEDKIEVSALPTRFSPDTNTSLKDLADTHTASDEYWISDLVVSPNQNAVALLPSKSTANSCSSTRLGHIPTLHTAIGNDGDFVTVLLLWLPQWHSNPHAPG